MHHNDEVQRNDEWFSDRSGIATASRYKDVMSEPKSKADKDAGNMSETAMSYALQILAEKLTGERKDFSSRATEWGTDNEPLAIQAYSEATGNNVLECGFVRHQEIATGASPDGVIGLDGCIEVKCPFNSEIHLKNKLTGLVPKDYIWQVQGQMWVLGAEWNDFVSFDPRMNINAGLSIVRVYRDEGMIAKLEDKIIKFNDKLEEMFNQLTKVEF